MRRIFLILVLLIVNQHIWSDYESIRIGIDLGWDLQRQVGLSTTDFDSSFSARPILSLMMDDKTEIAPYLILGMGIDKTGDTLNNLDFDIGAGVYMNWHFLRFEHFRLAIGAAADLTFTWSAIDTVYDKDISFSVSVAVPLAAELMMTENLMFRGQLNAAALVMTFRSYDAGLGNQSSFFMGFDTFVTVSDIAIGVFYRF